MLSSRGFSRHDGERREESQFLKNEAKSSREKTLILLREKQPLVGISPLQYLLNIHVNETFTSTFKGIEEDVH